MPDDYSERLRTATTTYVEQETISVPFPRTVNEYNLLLEKAFMSGASWYNLFLLERKQAELTAIKAEFAELQKEVVTNAH